MPHVTSESTDNVEDISFYDEHPYDEFWIGRDYEHLSEVIAIRRLLKGRRFKTALDYGGGYGRLAPVLANFAEDVILTDPSATLLEEARHKAILPNLITLLLKENGSIPVDNSSIDLVVMVRVLHHIGNPTKNFNEIYRILKPGGVAIIEVANSAHFVNRLKYLARFKSVPKKPIKIGTASNGIKEDTPFFNHNAKTIEKQLKEAGFSIENKLSVSNLRSSSIKKRVNINSLLLLERRSQKLLAKIAFGPSIFLLIEKN